MGNPVTWTDPSGFSALNELKLNFQARFKQAGGLQGLRNELVIGGTGGLIGYPLGVLSYAFLRASFETGKESILDSYCRQHKTSSIACSEWRDTREVDNYGSFFQSRFDDILRFAYDPHEHALSILAGAFVGSCIRQDFI
jgi:hypothetical protein